MKADPDVINSKLQPEGIDRAGEVEVTAGVMVPTPTRIVKKMDRNKINYEGGMIRVKIIDHVTQHYQVAIDNKLGDSNSFAIS